MKYLSSKLSPYELLILSAYFSIFVRGHSVIFGLNSIVHILFLCPFFVNNTFIFSSLFKSKSFPFNKSFVLFEISRKSEQFIFLNNILLISCSNILFSIVISLKSIIISFFSNK